jgi:hypothetical protein
MHAPSCPTHACMHACLHTYNGCFCMHSRHW